MPDEGDLWVVREFVNTYDVEKDIEALPNADDLVSWLRYAGLMVGPDEAQTADGTDLRHARALREAIRELLVANHDGEPAASAVAAVDEQARRVRLRPRFTPDGVGFEAAGSPVDQALGRLLAVIVRSMTDGGWARLKVCRNDTCRWAFYDASRSGAGRWCSMAVCGNRRKARAYRARVRSEPAQAERPA